MDHIRSAAFYLPALLILLQSRNGVTPAIVAALFIAAIDVADRCFYARSTPAGHAVCFAVYIATAAICGVWATR